MMGRTRESYGPFEVLERLGAGGMATVHRAIEHGADGFERTIALKRLLPHLAEDADFVRAFVREAKLASLLRHDNIVKLYELGRVGASYFISMEYIAGRDLRVILRQARRVCGPPPVEVSIALMTQLLDALDHAHGQRDGDGKPLGIIHRDISPANLLVNHSGRLKVIDFGVAKATVGHLMTHSGRIKGKLAYMAPEALAGHPLDGRSDLFAASVIAHELLTATPLFAARDDLQIIDRLQNMQPPPPSARNPSCSAELDEIVLRGLAKDPEGRWLSAADMRAAIAQLAVKQRMLATDREVARWVDEAFQRQASAHSTRLVPPLVPPPSAPPDGQTGAPARGESDEVMDIVWGTSSLVRVPVVLDEVPDVAAKLPLAHADPVVHRSDTSLILGGESSSSPRSELVSTILGLGQGHAPHAALPPSSVTGSNQRLTRPSGWAPGTGPPSRQPERQHTLDDVVRAARRTEAVVMAAMSVRRRRPLVPLLIASVAVSAAGGGVAWLISGGHRAQPAMSASMDQRARMSAHAQASTGGRRAAPVEGHGSAALRRPPPGGAVAAAQPAAPAPSPVSSSVVTPGPVTSGDGGPGVHTGEDREVRRKQAEGDDRTARRARPRRGRGDRERSRDADPPALGDEHAAEKIEKSDSGIAGPVESQATAPRQADPVPARTIESPRRQDLAPLPVPVGPPVTEGPGPEIRSRPAQPGRSLIVSASRAQRESGNAQPIRFPSGEPLPPRITAKLCIDTRGAVRSVTVLSPVSARVRNAVEQALMRWRYRPVVDAGEKVAVCFATAFPVQLD
jgi:eukaryotic-like serine/threonine-protein kinase